MSNNFNIEWKFSNTPVDYEDAISLMNQRVIEVQEGTKPELVWFLEHPPLYTKGTSAKEEELLAKDLLPVFATGRGGKYVYHGPGQRVVYLILDLKKRSGKNIVDIRKYVNALEEWVINTLAHFNVKGERREGRIGIWTMNGQKEEKICALGIRIKKYVTSHGIALNVNPDLQNYSGIVPCGIKDYGVCSLKSLGFNVTMQDVDEALKAEFNQRIICS